MKAYIIRRLLLVFPTMFIVSIIVFLTIRIIPGDTIEYMAATRYLTKDSRDAIRKQLGLDLPAHIQYGRWISGVIQGDLGRSLLTNLPVTPYILDKLPASLEMGGIAIIFALVLAIPIGIYSGMRPESFTDHILRSISILFICVPSFWLGTIILIYPAIWWNWSPPLFYVTFFEDPLTNLQIVTIPAFILGMWLSGIIMRLTRTMMLEVLRQDYIRTAWSKGLREKVIILKHALKNSMIPVITMIGLQLPVMIGGAIVVEYMFNIPGIGSLVVETLLQRDYTILSGLNLFMAGFVLLSNLLIDISYAWLDPRIQFS